MYHILLGDIFEINLRYLFKKILGMETIAGLPTVVGGVSTTQFLSSVEVLDNSNNDDAPLGLEWRIAAHSMATPRYDFALSTVPITQVLGEEMMNKMDVCGMDEEG